LYTQIFQSIFWKEWSTYTTSRLTWRYVTDIKSFRSTALLWQIFSRASLSSSLTISPKNAVLMSSYRTIVLFSVYERSPSSVGCATKEAPTLQCWIKSRPFQAETFYYCRPFNPDEVTPRFLPFRKITK
jgi:hypothetical protein